MLGNYSQRAQAIIRALRRLLGLYIESAKLNIAERLAMLLAASVVLILCIVLGVFALAFFSGALLELLALVVSTPVAYVIMGGFYLLIIFGILALRKPLIVDPIARFVSRLFLQNDNNDLSDSDRNEQQF